MSVKVIALDAFGTIIHRPNDLMDPYKGLFQDCDQSSTPQSRRRLLTTPMDFNDTIDVYLPFAKNRDELCLRAEERLAADFAQSMRMPGLDELVEAAHENKLELVVISNLAYRYGELVRKLIPDIPAQIFSYDVGSRKPEKEIFLHAAKFMGVEPHEMVMAGDKYQNDVVGPREAGYADGFWFPPRYQTISTSQMEKYNGIGNLPDIIPALKKRGLIL